MKRPVSDSDTIRRQNRWLVLDVIRRLGPLPRTQIARKTGLSNATITAISNDMVGQSILADLVEVNPNQKTRGRPAVRLGFNRSAAYVLLIEIDVNHARFSLVDYSGTLVDRIESPLTPNTFLEISPVEFLAGHITQIRERNGEEASRILRIMASIQGILDREGRSLKWSPVSHLADHDLVEGLGTRFQIPVTLFKRGRLLAEGVHWLFPEMANANVATIFVGSTVAMGVSLHGNGTRAGEDAPTEFGHMNHIPNGALCRCGTRGCIEAYASDYGILRTAYGLPDKTAPAPAVPAEQFSQLIGRAQTGDRDAIHAFNIAGNAIGLGVGRLMSIFDPSHILIVGPGSRALPFMRAEIEAAIAGSLIARVHGIPEIITHEDESEPIFKGLTMKALENVDQTDFAALPSPTLTAINV